MGLSLGWAKRQSVSPREQFPRWNSLHTCTHKEKWHQQESFRPVTLLGLHENTCNYRNICICVSVYLFMFTSTLGTVCPYLQLVRTQCFLRWWTGVWALHCYCRVSWDNHRVTWEHLCCNQPHPMRDRREVGGVTDSRPWPQTLTNRKRRLQRWKAQRSRCYQQKKCNNINYIRWILKASKSKWQPYPIATNC